MKLLYTLTCLFLLASSCIGQNEKVIDRLSKQLAQHLIENQAKFHSPTGFETLFYAVKYTLSVDNPLFCAELNNLQFTTGMHYHSILHFLRPKVLTRFFDTYFDSNQYMLDSTYLEFTESSFSKICTCLQEKSYIEIGKEKRNNVYATCLRQLYMDEVYHRKAKTLMKETDRYAMSKVENMKSILLAKKCTYYRAFLLNHLLEESKTNIHWEDQELNITYYFDVLKKYYREKKDSVLSVKFSDYPKNQIAIEQLLNYQPKDSVAAPDYLVLLNNGKWAWVRTVYTPAKEKDEIIYARFYMVFNKLEKLPTIEQLYCNENTIPISEVTINSHATFASKNGLKLKGWEIKPYYTKEDYE
jgi:hypothetical protein